MTNYCQRKEGGEQIQQGISQANQDSTQETPTNQGDSVNGQGTQSYTQSVGHAGQASPIQIVPDLDGDGKVSAAEHLIFWAVVTLVTAVTAYLL